MKLTQKQERFCLHYFQSNNATQSYRAAGYKRTNNPRSLASEYLAKPCVQARLAELRTLANVAASEDFVIADELERRKLLTEVARHKIEAPVSAGHKIAAISEMNKMEHIYEERPTPPGLVQNFVFVLPDGTKVTPKALIDGNSDRNS